jgi:hypothetical protein
MKPTRDRAVIVRRGKLELVTGLAAPITLEYMQSVVDGYIEIADQIPAGSVMLQVWCNEEGKLRNLPLNVYRRDGEPLVGTLIVLAGDMKSGDTLPLTLQEARRVKLVSLGLMREGGSGTPVLTIE